MLEFHTNRRYHSPEQSVYQWLHSSPSGIGSQNLYKSKFKHNQRIYNPYICYLDKHKMCEHKALPVPAVSILDENLMEEEICVYFNFKLTQPQNEYRHSMNG